ncbi:MAG: hypothetical protein JXR71_12120 [Bacteroidales bacterium]|nr:hypothetical protein [Bacteroidales bacterium]
MKKIFYYFMLFGSLQLFVLTGCKDNTTPDPSQSAYKTLTTYMVANNLDLPNLLSGWVIDASSIVDSTDFSIPNYYVFDLRSASDFANGHIKNAVNVTLADVVNTAKSYTDKPILVVCYTGQTAAHAVMALRLSGFSNAQVLKFGFAEWNASFQGSWANSVGNAADNNSNWVFTASPTPSSFDEPNWTSTATDGAGILADRVNQMLHNGFQGIASSDVLSNPTGYAIYNFWDAATYTSIGHFAGAYQYGTISISGGQLAGINPATTNLVYCYTGMTSSMVTAWLNVLGYNVKSIKFGVNSLRYNALKTAGKPTWHGAYNYTYVQ